MSPLPGVLAHIEDVAGHAATLAVALAHGGQEIYIPTPAWLATHPGYYHPLAPHLDAATFAALADRLGGTSVYIPLAARACAIHLAERGQSVAQIAARLHISTITARRYVRRV